MICKHVCEDLDLPRVFELLVAHQLDLVLLETECEPTTFILTDLMRIAMLGIAVVFEAEPLVWPAHVDPRFARALDGHSFCR